MTEANFDNEKFFVDTVIVGVQHIINDLPDPFRGNIAAFDVNGEFIYRIDNSAKVWFNYDNIWVFLCEKNYWDNHQTKGFLEDMLEKHFKKGVLTSVTDMNGCTTRLEKHFKKGVLTATYWRCGSLILEEHFKKHWLELQKAYDVATKKQDHKNHKQPYLTHLDYVAGNILISEFIGPSEEWNDSRKGKIKLYCHADPTKAFCEARELQFHKSWDKLMPVVKMIFEKEPEYIEISSIYTGLKMVEIEFIWESVVQFIKQSNK